MTQGYAKDQPAGFINRITKVAMVGAGGQVGTFVAKALLATGKLEITALQRKDSNTKPVDGVKVVQVDYDDEAGLVEALKGQQVFLISINVMAAPEAHFKLIAAAGKAGVPWIIPNSWGMDPRLKKLGDENLDGKRIRGGIEAVEKTNSSWIAICNGFWYEYSLAMGPDWYGFDFKNKTVEFIDDGTTQINTSTWDQVGRAVAKLLTLPELPQDENDTSVTISRWRNKPLLVTSFLVSQRQMLNSVNKVLGTTDADWTIKNFDHQERYDKAMESFKGGNFSSYGRLLYTRTFFPLEKENGNYEAYEKGANEDLGLPKEDLDEATKRGIGLADQGYNPFVRQMTK